MRISDWSSDVCSSDLRRTVEVRGEEDSRDHHRRDGDHRQAERTADEVDLALEARALVAGGTEQPGHAAHLGGHPGGGHDGPTAPPGHGGAGEHPVHARSEEHTSELQSLMRISSAVFCFKKTNIVLIHPLQHNTMQTATTTL